MSKRITLFKKYVLIFGTLTGCSLLLSGLLNINLSYQENKQAVIRLQREKAESAAARIGQYLFDIEQQISVITTPKQGTSALDQRCQDIQYLRHIAAISEIYLLDPHGREYFRVSRHVADVLRGGTDFSSSDVFRLPKSGHFYRSPIYFRDGAPLMTVAMAVGPEEAGITVAEVYLEFLLDGITRIKVGNSGHAYAVDASGLLIAHPDIGLVFKKTSLAALPQVQAALKEPANNNHEHVQAISLEGKPVLTAYGTIPQLGWFVFVEEPLAEAYRPLYSLVIRSTLLVFVGIFFTLFVCLIVVRRMMQPIHSLQDGAALIGRGVLDHYITVSTGDELEELANEFNNMAKQLQISYATLESKVVERTQAIARINEELAALSITDCLTGIANRRRFDEVLSQEYARHARSGAELSLIMLDIDHFKTFNDSYGHVAGDECLRRIGRVLADCANRPADLAARYGGEEFACILPETNRTGAVVIAEQIRQGIQALAIPHRGADTADCVTASLGVATMHCTTENSVTGIISQADELLYRAKSRGRNQVEFATTQNYELTAAASTITGDFVRMVWKDSFCCGNPQIDAQHQSLFHISNELLEAVLSGCPASEISLIITRLLRDVEHHFRDEENILEAADFPGISHHAAEHVRLLAKGMELSRQFSAANLSVGGLFQYLAYDVVMTHMLGADREYYPFIRTEVAESTQQ
jgi:diguanylate cyclase (GGDEF)-like protein/hemerythrin-like metal-binding protein